MGCSSTTNKRRLNQNYKLPVETKGSENNDVVKMFKESYRLAKKVEKYRRKLSPRYNDILKATGAIVLKNPNFENIIYCFYAILSYVVDDPKEIKDNLEFHLEAPYVKLKNLAKDNVYLLQLVERLSFFLGEVYKLHSNISNVKAKLNRELSVINNYESNQDKFFEEFKINPQNASSEIRHLKRNLSNIRDATEIITLLDSICEDATKSFVISVDKYTSDKDIIKSIIETVRANVQNRVNSF